MGKRPMQLNRRPASTTRPETWTTYDQVEYVPHGIMLGDGLACYDLDHCIRPDGSLTSKARAVLRSVESPIWVEVSMSGDGLHIFHYAPEAPGWKRDGVEFYSRARFIVVTGQRFTGRRRVPTCAECGQAFRQKPGRGRPRRYCYECKPRDGRYEKKPAGDCAWCGNPCSRAGARFCSGRCKDLMKRLPCSECGRPTGTYRHHADAAVCRDCKRDGVPHGTEARYRIGCRCVDCMDARAEAMRLYRVQYKDRYGVSLSTVYGRDLPSAFRLTGIERRQVFERDGWTCHICGRIAPAELIGTNDRLEPTIDHIAPVSLTLFPDNSEGNLKLAHRGCNSMRGNRDDPRSRKRREARTARGVA